MVGPGGVHLCGSCQLSQRCRLGNLSERVDAHGTVHFELLCGAEHEGGLGVAHGGWAAAVLTEMGGHVPIAHGGMAVTGTLTVRFVKPVPVGVPLRGRAWIDRQEGRKWHISAEILLRSSGAILATGTGVWISRSADHYERFGTWLSQQGGSPPTA